MPSLRMSQILDMYYSRKGVAFDANYRACQRKEKFSELIKNIDLITETANVAKLLTYSHITYEKENFIPQTDERLDEIAKYVVKNFIQHIGNSCFIIIPSPIHTSFRISLIMCYRGSVRPEFRLRKRLRDGSDGDLDCCRWHMDRVPRQKTYRVRINQI